MEFMYLNNIGYVGSDQQVVMGQWDRGGGGSLGPQSYFQLIGNSVYLCMYLSTNILLSH